MKDQTEGSSICTEDRFPVSVVIEKREKMRDRWSFTEWKATGILPGNRNSGAYPKKSLVHDDGECQRYLWTNFNVELLKDGAESYWNNLVASEPALFVVCRGDEDTGELEPFLVTANYDDIIGYLEVDDQVFSLPIPSEIYAWLEQYIVNNYIPQERRKRKRTKWEDEHDKTPPPTRQH